MDENSRTNLGREKVLLWTAIFGLLKVIAEVVIEVVSYGRRHPKLRVYL